MTDLPAYDDPLLLHELRQGDEQAFEQVFRSYYPSLCFLARRIQNTPGVAEEVAQDSLYKLWERRLEFATWGAVKGFLYTSTKNACLDSLIKESKLQKRQQVFTLENSDFEKGIDEQIMLSEILRELSQAIDQLPPQCSKIMKMLFEDGKKAREIADKLGVSISTIHNQKARGIELLKKKFGGTNLSISILLAYLSYNSSI